MAGVYVRVIKSVKNYATIYQAEREIHSMPKLKSFLALAGIVTAGMAIATSAGAVSLKVSTCLASNHDQVVTYFSLFHNPLHEADNGIKLRYLGGPEVTPRKKQAPALKRGLVDIIFCPSSYYAGMVPEARLTAISNRGHRELRKNGAYDEMQKAWSKGANMRILAWPFWGGTTFHVYLIDKPKFSKKTGLDLTGRKIRAAALYLPFLKAMGATPVVISPGDVYTSLQRGVVSGLAWPEGAITKYGWQEYIKYKIEPGFWRSSSMVTMNLDKYNALTKSQRTAIDDASLKFEDESGAAQQKIIAIDNKKVYAAGVKRVKLEPAIAKAYLETVNGATWDDSKKRKLTVPYATMRRLLYSE